MSQSGNTHITLFTKLFMCCEPGKLEGLVLMTNDHVRSYILVEPQESSLDVIMYRNLRTPLEVERCYAFRDGYCTFHHEHNTILNSNFKFKIRNFVLTWCEFSRLNTILTIIHHLRTLINSKASLRQTKRIKCE